MRPAYWFETLGCRLDRGPHSPPGVAGFGSAEHRDSARPPIMLSLHNRSSDGRTRVDGLDGPISANPKPALAR